MRTSPAAGREGPPRYIFFSERRASSVGRAKRRTTSGTSGAQDAVVPAVAQALREVDRACRSPACVRSTVEIAAEVAPLWMLTTLLGLFAAGSLMIAAIGQYAVVAFDGRRRTREFGLRIALGASSQQLDRVGHGGELPTDGHRACGRIRAERRGRLRSWRVCCSGSRQPIRRPTSACSCCWRRRRCWPAICRRGAPRAPIRSLR